MTRDAEPPRSVFDGIRVLDLGARSMGTTLASSLLAEFGADAVKIDHPGEGPAPFAGIYVKGDVHLPYKVQGRNKRHITLDVSKPKGRDLLLALVERSDVLIETNPPGTMEGWGCGWEVLEASNPRLVFCRLSDFGQDGPYAGRRLDSRTAEAFAGFCHINGDPDRPPLSSQMDIGGEVAGLWAAFGIVLALYHRDVAGGGGQVIDIGLYEPLFRQIQTNITPFATKGVADGRQGNRRSNGIPWVDSHATSDGRYFSYSAATRASFWDINLAMGLHTDPRFTDLPATYEHRDDFHAEAKRWMAGHTVEQAEEAFARFDCAASLCNDAEDLLAPAPATPSGQMSARDLVVEIDDGELGRVRMPGVLPKLSATPGSVTWAGEAPGARNGEVYAELLGLTDHDLGELRREGVL